ncbi:MAG TPA: hypothetical protein VMW87_05680 [Spirochaetia bacterium]|nr:hypothetical protein [Spirochaetia bacterium]
MKFKIIFVLFNAIIVFSFLFIFLMPFFILGWDYTQLFWSRNWFLGAIFVAIMAVLNGYFIANWKLFGFLEREDWDGLIGYIEHRLYDRKIYRAHEVKILINTYVVKSNTEAILRLETVLRAERERLIPVFALQFGIPHLLKNDPIDMEIYFGELKENPHCRDRDWIVWNFAFSLMLQQKSEEAKAHLVAIAKSPRNPVLNLLTLYLLDAYGTADGEIAETVEKGKAAVRARFSADRWHQEIEKQKSNLQVLVLAKLIEDASDWTYPERRKTADTQS